jgi:hypothetical protein
LGVLLMSDVAPLTRFELKPGNEKRETETVRGDPTPFVSAQRRGANRKKE